MERSDILSYFILKLFFPHNLNVITARHIFVVKINQFSKHHTKCKLKSLAEGFLGENSVIPAAFLLPKSPFSSLSPNTHTHLKNEKVDTLLQGNVDM